MSKFLCVCGETIRISGEIPNPQEVLLMSDAEFDDYAGNVSAEDLYAAFKRAYLCPRSGHLWVFWDGLDQEATCYEPATAGEARRTTLP